MLNRNHKQLPQELKEVQILINQIKDIVKWKTKLVIYATTSSPFLKN
jgi:hypothetical protein